MKSHVRKVMMRSAGRVLLAALLVIAAGLSTVGFCTEAVQGQRRFATPDEARQALIVAVQAKDHAALREIFGPVAAELESNDPVERAAEFERFSTHIQEGSEIVPEGDARATLLIGGKKWPFPVPLVKEGGTWKFDTDAGREEILNRRIGRNELNAVQVCKAYVDAQREYYAMPVQEGDQIPKYAQRKFSRAGKRDGLYWPTPPGEKESPLGLLVANAQAEGYMKERKAGEKGPRPFHGYFFRVLKKQGPHAPGGAYDYVINGNMVGGFALVAYPAKWGTTGVMTFIVNQRGRVYQKNLGPKTVELARKMTTYDPDLSWKLME